MSTKNGLLVINAGSSSIKFSLFVTVPGGGEPDLLYKGQIEGIGVAPTFQAQSAAGAVLEDVHFDRVSMTHGDLLAHLLDWLARTATDVTLQAAGHRVVHGGPRYDKPLLVTDALLDELAALLPLAPLHQGHNLTPIRALAQIHPGLKQVVCFDTAFHRASDSLAKLFALPRWLLDEGVQRYGFHGLSYEYIAGRLAQLDPALAAGKVVVCHLGSGASMAALSNGRSVASTLGFTALDGIPMGTRCGTIDPGVVLYLMQSKGMDAKQIETLLYKQSGLLGLSGVSNDMRVLASSDNPHAAEAVEYFVYRIGRELGSLAAALGGLDGIVFTAGIGERSAAVRAAVLQQAGWLGFAVDDAANGSVREGLISAAGSKPVLVIPTNEELVIARHCSTLLG